MPEYLYYFDTDDTAEKTSAPIAAETLAGGAAYRLLVPTAKLGMALFVLSAPLIGFSAISGHAPMAWDGAPATSTEITVSSSAADQSSFAARSDEAHGAGLSASIEALSLRGGARPGD